MATFSSKIKNFRLQSEKEHVKKSKFLANGDVEGGN